MKIVKVTQDDFNRLLAEVREQGTGNGEQSEELSFYASKMIIFLLLQEV